MQPAVERAPGPHSPLWNCVYVVFHSAADVSKALPSWEPVTNLLCVLRGFSADYAIKRL